MDTDFINNKLKFYYDLINMAYGYVKVICKFKNKLLRKIDKI